MSANTKELDSIQQEADKVRGRLTRSVNSIVITDPESYEDADTLRSKIVASLDSINEKLNPIIDPIRKGLDKLYEFRRELKSPFDDLLSELDSGMTKYKLEERKKIEAEEAEVRIKAQEAAKTLRAQEVAQLLAMAEDNKGTPDEQRYLDQAEELLTGKRPAPPTPVVYRNPNATKPIAVSGSSARFVETPEVFSLQLFVKAVADGEIPLDLLSVNAKLLKQHYKANPAAVKVWPGVKITDKGSIARKPKS